METTLKTSGGVVYNIFAGRPAEAGKALASGFFDIVNTTISAALPVQSVYESRGGGAQADELKQPPDSAEATESQGGDDGLW